MITGRENNGTETLRVPGQYAPELTGMLTAWLRALRLKQWVKNFFVFIPFLVGPRFGINEYLVLSLAGVILFGMLSSAVYLFNDIIDIEADRMHPEKRLRPIASGRIRLPAAFVVAILLAGFALGCAAMLNTAFFFVLAAYAANNVLYTLYLKNKTVLDIISIAVGFVLRAYGGGYLIGIEITKWMVACVFALSVFLGFGKRRAECEMLKCDASKARAVNESYSAPKLDILLGTSAAITILAYMIYSLAPETQIIHRTDKIIFTTPFVMYCMYRYILKVQEARKGDPFDIILHDRGFVLAGCLWIVSLLLLIRF